MVNFTTIVLIVLSLAYQAAAQCTAQPGVTEGTLAPALPGAGHDDGTVVTVTCNTGFAIASATANCDGTADSWTPADLTCTAFHCDAEPTVTNDGGVTPPLPSSPGYTGNTVVTAFCDTLYITTAGANTAECTAANTWTPASMDCTPACTSLPGVGGGTLVPDVLPAAGGFLGGETVTITCDAGFSTDTSTSTCISSTSEWIPGQLICTGKTAMLRQN